MRNNKLDQRIVEMSFENKKFEEGISKSKNSLKKFSDALKNSDIKEDFSGLDKSVNTLSNSFSILEQIGIGALRRIGDAAVNAGASLIKRLTVDQLTAGLDKYQQKIEAVQTMVSAGYGLAEVEESMAQLMWFSDETSYSFADMANNMAKFIAAGVDIKTSERAMQGIATWAAHSGKNTVSASIAMYNLSQAISMGYVDTMNWRSVMNQNMNTTMFKRIAIDVAEATGAISKGQVSIQNFDSNLRDKWFTNDVLLKTLDQYSAYADKVREVQESMDFDTAKQAMDYMDEHADQFSDVLNQVGNAAFKSAQVSKSFMDSINATMDIVSSGWLKTYEILFGTLDEAIANFSALTEILWTIFASGDEGRNDMLAWLKKLGGISNVFQGLKNIAIGFLLILRPITKAFDQIFPPKTKHQWLAITAAFKDFTASLHIAELTGDKIRRTFAGLFAVVDMGWHVVKLLGHAVFELVKTFLPLGDGVLGASASLGDLLVNINKAVKSSQLFQYGILAIKIGAAILREQLTKTIAVVQDFVTGLRNAENPFEYLSNIGSRMFAGFIDGVKMAAAWLSGKFTTVVKGIFKLFNKDFDETIVGVWPTILEVLKKVVAFITGTAVGGFTSFGDAIKSIDFSKIATFVVGGVILLFIKQLTDLTGAMAGFIDSLSGVVKAFFRIKILSILVRDIALAIATLTASIWILSTIPADDLERSFLGLAKAITVFVVAYALIQGINVAARKMTSDKDMAISAFGLTGVAAALLIMVAAVKVISTVDRTEVWNAALVLGAMLGFITVYQVLTAFISKIPGQQKVSMNLLGMSLSVSMLIGTLVLLNFLTHDEIESSLGKLASILLVVAALEGVFALTARLGGGKQLSVSILQLAVGITAMIATMKLLTLIDYATIKQGLSKLALIALTIVGIEIVMGIVGRISGGKKVQTNIFAMSVGILAMIGLVAIVGTMTTEVLDQGIKNLAKIAGIVIGIQLFTALSARIAGGNKVQRILGAVSFTLLSFTGIIAILGNMGTEVIDQGIETLKKMIGLIAAVEIITALTSRIGGNSKMFSSLLGVTIAIVALTGSLALLSMGDQGFLREAVKSLLIASVALGVLAFSVEKISSSASVISKESKGLKENAKKVGNALLGLGFILIATIGFFHTLRFVLPIFKDVTKKDFAIFTIGVAAMSALLFVFGRFGAQLTDMQAGDQFNGIKAGIAAMIPVLLATFSLFVALGMALPVIKDLTIQDFVIFMTGVAAMSALLFAFGRFGAQITQTQFEEQARGVKAGIAAMIPLLLATVGFFGALSVVLHMPGIKDLTVDQVALFTFGLGVVSALIVSFGYIGKKFEAGDFEKSFMGLLSGFIALGAILFATAGFFYTLSSVLQMEGIKDLKAADFGTFIIGLTLTAALVGAMALLAPKFEKVGAGGIGGLVATLKGVVIAILALGLVVLAVAGLAYLLAHIIPEATTLAKGIELLVAIGDGIGRFVGSIIGGISGGVLESVGNSIANFAAKMDGVTFSPGAFEAISSLAAAIILITGATFVQGLNDFFGLGTASIDTFGSQLAGLVKAVTQISVKNAGKATEVLAAMKPMVENLEAFAIVAHKIPESGGKWGEFWGENDIDEFGKKLVLFVAAFTRISPPIATYVSNVLTAMKPMVDNLEAFAIVAHQIPNSGGKWGEVFGENDIDDFGLKLAKFVRIFTFPPLLATYASSVLAAMIPMAANLEKFAVAANLIPNSGGWITKFFGDNTIDGFGLQLSRLIAIFGELDETKLGLAVSNLNLMNTSMLPNLKTFAEFSNTLDAYDGIDITVFGNNLRNFVETLADTDFTIVAPAMAAMDIVTTSFQTLGTTVLQNAKESFENNKAPFQLAISTVLAEPIAQLEIQKDTLLNTVSAIFYGVLNRSATYVRRFKELGENIIDGLSEGIGSRKRNAVDTMKDVVSSLINSVRKTGQIRSPSKVFERLGAWCTLGLAQGIKGETKAAVNASADMAKATDEAVRKTLGIHSNSTKGRTSGRFFVGGFAEGIETSAPKAYAAVKEVAGKSTDFFGDTIRSGLDKITQAGNRLGIDTSKIFGTNVLSTVSGFGTNMVDSLLDQMYNPAVAAAALAGGEAISDAFGSGLNGGVSGGISGAATQAKTAIQKLKEELDELNFYGMINLEEELLRYQTLRKNYKEGSAEDKQLDREVYTRLKTIYNAQLSYIDGIKKAKEHSVKELAALETKYNTDIADELESAELVRMKTREEFAEKQTAINEKLLSDIEAQNNAYENAVKSRANAIASSYGLFEGVNLDARADGFELLKNLHDQNDALTVWKHSLGELEKRGISGALLEELQAMGPSANAELRALLSLTDEQLTEYVGLYERKYSFATRKAEDELADLKHTTVNTIQTLTSQAATELEVLSGHFDATMIQINTESKSRLRDLETSYNESLGDINTTLETNLTTMKTQFDTTMKTIKGQTEAELIALVEANKEQLKQLNEDSDEKLGEVKNTFGSGAAAIVSSFKEPLKEIIPDTVSTLADLIPPIKTAFDDVNSEFITAGLNAAAGFARGIRDGAYLAVNAATFLARTAVTTAKQILDEKSPSKVFEEIGKFISMGFANGIINYAHQAEKATEEMARGPIAAVSEALANMEEDDTLSFTITPVIDLSAIRSIDLSRMLNTPVNLGTTSTKLAAETVQNGTRTPQPTTTEDGTNNTTNNSTIQMTNNFSVRTDDDIRKISNKLGNLLDRYSNARGVTV